MADKEGARAASIVFRILALVLVVAATVVMGTASQVVVADGRRGWTSYVVVSYRHYNALVYFVAAGVIAAVCTASGLYLSAVNAKPTTGFGALVPLLDVLAQGFLFSAAGAAFATRGDASPAGDTWAATSGGGGGGSVCDAAGAFCGRVTVAAGVGAVAAVAVAVAALARDGGLRSFGRCCDF